MATGYIFNKNGDIWDVSSQINKPEPVIGIAIDKVIPTRMLIFTNSHVYIIDRLIDQDKSTNSEIIFKLDVHVTYRYKSSIKEDYPVGNPGDFNVFKYIGTKPLVFINKLDENCAGEKYIAFISDSYNKIADGVYVKISSIKTDGNPIDDTEAFIIDRELFIHINGSNLFDDSLALAVIHTYNNEIDSLLVYTNDHTYEKVNTEIERCEGHGLLIEIKDLKLASKISEFTLSDEALKQAFDWYKSTKVDPYIVESHSLYIMNVIRTPDVTYLWDKRKLI